MNKVDENDVGADGAGEKRVTMKVITVAWEAGDTMNETKVIKS